MINTLLRVLVGGTIGFYAVAIFSSNAYIAVIAAVVCGVALDKLLKK